MNNGLVKIGYYNKRLIDKQNDLNDTHIYTIIKKKLIDSTIEEELFLTKYFVKSYHKAIGIIEKIISKK